MKKLLLSVAAALLFTTGYVAAEKVHDWHDLDGVHKHIEQAIHEMEHARAANHYDMGGHAVRAEEFLHQAERELNEAVESARRGQ